MRRDAIAAEIIRCRNELASLNPAARSTITPPLVTPAAVSHSTPLAGAVGDGSIDIGGILAILNRKFNAKGFTMKYTTATDIEWRESGKVTAAAHITDHTIYLSIYPTSGGATQQISLHSAADAESVTV
jgi:hypothetical protein